jgi:peroxiredoxin
MAKTKWLFGGAAVLAILALVALGLVLNAQATRGTTATTIETSSQGAPQSSNAPEVAPAAVTFNTPAPPLLPANVSKPVQSKSSSAAPEFTIQTIDGQTVSLAQTKGKVLGVFFSASWCGSCVAEAQAWGDLYKKYREQGLQVLIVDVDPNDTKNDLLRFKQLAGDTNHWWAMDTAFDLVRAFRVRSLDTTFIIGRDGTMVYADQWPTSFEVLEREVKKALQ